MPDSVLNSGPPFMIGFEKAIPANSFNASSRICSDLLIVAFTDPTVLVETFRAVFVLPDTSILIAIDCLYWCICPVLLPAGRFVFLNTFHAGDRLRLPPG